MVLRAFVLSGLILFSGVITEGVHNSETQVEPVGNVFPTLARFSLQADESEPNRRQFVGVFGMRDRGGGTPDQTIGGKQSMAKPADKVALYAGADCQAGGAPCWTYNSSLVVEPGFWKGGGHGATGSEIDVTNNDVDTGENDGYAGAIGEPGYYGMAITGVGSKRVTAALSIGGPGDRTLFNRGLVFLNNPVRQCSICDYGIATIALDVRGTHQVVLDTSKARVAAAIRLGNGQNIVSVRSDGGGSQLLDMGGDDYVNLAPLGASGVRIGQPGKPIVLQGPTVSALFTPPSSHSPCSPGQVADGSDFHYVCVARDRWKRVALSDF